MAEALKVTTRNVYGVPKIYPVCDRAKALAKIAGTETLTNKTLDIASSELGYDFELVPDVVLVGMRLKGAA